MLKVVMISFKLSKSVKKNYETGPILISLEGDRATSETRRHLRYHGT